MRSSENQPESGLTIAGQQTSRVLAPLAAVGEESRLRVVDGSGCYVQLVDGRWVLDASSQHGAALLGHRHPELTAALIKASAGPVVGEGTGWDDRDKAAADLFEIAFAGEPWAAAVYFCVSGSEANDLALHLARTLTRRYALVARSGAYHGAVGLALEASPDPAYDGGLTTRGGSHIAPVPANVPLRTLSSPVREGSGGNGDVTGVEWDAERQLEATELMSGAAAVITDSGSGHVFPAGDWQDGVARCARAAELLWITDEVWTAPARLGSWFAFQVGQERPDLVTLGKGITGGAAPGGAIVLSQRVVELLDGARWQTISSPRGHPLAIAAMRAVLQVLKRESLIQRAADLGELFRTRLHALHTSHPSVHDVRGRGLLWGLQLNPPSYASANLAGQEPARAPSQIVLEEALLQGVLVATYGPLGVTIAPPLIIDEKEIDVIASALDHALSRAETLLP